MRVSKPIIDPLSKNSKQGLNDALSNFNRSNLFIGIPAIVTNVGNYEKYQTVNVRPVIDDDQVDDIIIKSVEIKDVIVKLPNAGGFTISMPIQVNDRVTLHWAHRDISKYLLTDGYQSVSQLMSMVADLRDCWVEAGFATYSNNQSPHPTSLEIRGNGTVIELTQEGNLNITTKEATLKANKYLIDCPETHMTGNLLVDGNQETKGTVTSKSGMFSPSYSGIGGSGGTMSIGEINAESSIKINGKEINGHDHEGQVPPF